MASVDMFSMPEKLPTFVHHQNEEVHVLAVDDSIIDRKVIERLLKISSCKVTTVDSGRRALQLLGLDGEKGSVGLGGLKVNMIITDYWMPGMTGYELLKKIKESSTFKEVPVVIMSSENVLPRINRCLEEGAEDFLVKPVQLSDVRRLRDNITREDQIIFNGDQNKINNNKRKLEDSRDVHLSSSSSSDEGLSTPSSSPSRASDFLSDSSDSSLLESPSRRFRATSTSDSEESFL